MLVAPTEPAEFGELGERTLLPEKYGVDFMFACRGQWWGVQRKEYGDFVNSVHDGRLSKEIGQMQQLAGALLMIEGAGRFTNEGELIGRGQWTRKGEHAYLWSVQERGVWVDHSEGKSDTINQVRSFEAWVRKGSHRATHTRPGASSTWGRASSREWAIHLLCGFDGVGTELAARILDQVGIPLAWRVTVEQLMEVQGIGKKRADKLIAALAIGG